MAQGKAVVITTEGTKSVVTFTIGNSYKILSDTVEGMIECVRLSENEDLWCNENGIAEGKPLNLIASAIYSETFNAGNPILGNVIITGGADDEGETLGLSDELIEKWMAYSKQVVPTSYLTNPLYL
jgi:hypothetical protein